MLDSARAAGARLTSSRAFTGLGVVTLLRCEGTCLCLGSCEGSGVQDLPLLSAPVPDEDGQWKELGHDFTLVEGEMSSRRPRKGQECEILTK